MKDLAPKSPIELMEIAGLSAALLTVFEEDLPREKAIGALVMAIAGAAISVPGIADGSMENEFVLATERALRASLALLRNRVEEADVAK